MVENEFDARKCECCQTQNPNMSAEESEEDFVSNHGNKFLAGEAHFTFQQKIIYVNHAACVCILSLIGYRQVQRRCRRR